MKYFVYRFRVQVLVCTIILLAHTTKVTAKVETGNVIADFLKTFIRPFVRSASLINSNITTPVESKIVKLIKRKIKEMKPFVQDDDEMVETEDNLTLHGNEETTLIEFLPKKARKTFDGTEEPIIIKPTNIDPLKSSINKYKQLREQIKVMLEEESITDATKKLILTTLDEIIAKLIESQCTWMPDKKLPIFHNDTNEAIAKLRNMTNKQWQNLRHQYIDYLTQRKEKENAFMDQFHHFFSSVINDTYNLSERYRIRCQLVQLNNKKTLRVRENKLEKPKCENFKICSNELKEFFVDFYNYVNDTAVSVFKNYASMYVRDVNVDFGVDKEVVVSLINSLGNKAERRVTKVYKHELKTFKLDPDKNKNANVKHLRDFIKSVAWMTKTTLNENLVKELGSTKSKLLMTVKEDLVVNLDVDMENLERHYLDVICTPFVLCNGRYSTRRSGEKWTFRPKSNSEVFVKVQLSLDDEVKNMVARSGIIQYFKQNKAPITPNKFQRRNMNVVTRTSLATFNLTRTPKSASVSEMKVLPYKGNVTKV